MAAEVRYSDVARFDLQSIFDWVAGEAGIEIAATYVGRIRARCESLCDLPARGTPRGRSRERSLSFERRATILDRLENMDVRIVGIFHAGREIDIG